METPSNSIQLRVIVFGASGATGRLIVHELLQEDKILVLAVLRPESRGLELQHSRLRVVLGSPEDPRFVEGLVQKGDIVISALGQNRKTRNPWSPMRSPINLMEVAISNILNACDKKGASRFLYMSAFGAGSDWLRLPSWMRFFVQISNVRYAYADHGRAEALVRKFKTPVTILKPTILVDGQSHTNPKVVTDQPVSSLARINRKAIATYLRSLVRGAESASERVELTGA